MALSASDVVWPIVLPSASMTYGGEVKVYFARGQIPCQVCGGIGTVQGGTCPACGGCGFEEVPRCTSLILPGNLADGERLVLEGQGNFDPQSRQFGRLVLVCWRAPLEGTKLEDGVMVSTVTVTPEACTTGGRFTVPTPDGPRVVDLPAPLWDGREFVVPRRGAQAPWGEPTPLRIRVQVEQGPPPAPSPSASSAASLLTAQAREAVLAGDAATAIQRCGEALALDPAFAMAHAVLGAALTRSGCHAEAIKELKTALHLDHRQERFWFYLGCAYTAAGMPAAAASAAYAGMLRTPRSTRLRRLWREALRRIFATDATCGALSPDDLGSLELIKSDLERHYVGAAVAALSEMVSRNPSCARLRYQLAAVLWLLSVEGVEAQLGAACSHLVRAIAGADLLLQAVEALASHGITAEAFRQLPELHTLLPTKPVDMRSLQQAIDEYTAALDELLELIRQDGAVSDLIAAAAALVAEGQLRDALPMLISAAERVLAGEIGSWYQWARADLRGRLPW